MIESIFTLALLAVMYALDYIAWRGNALP